VEELAKRGLFYAMKLFREMLPKDLFRFGISKRANHEYIVYRKSINIKREYGRVRNSRAPHQPFAIQLRQDSTGVLLC
jgi:hypothetical protein